MKKIIPILPFLVSLSMMSQSTLTINSIAVTEVNPVKRGETFNVEIKYQADKPIQARIQFWMTFFNGKEYDAWFINEQRNVIQVGEGEENKEKKVALKMKFPSETVQKKYSPNGFGEHDKFEIRPTSKLLKGENYSFRIYATKEDQIIDATMPDTNVNIKATAIRNKKTAFFASPNIPKIQ